MPRPPTGYLRRRYRRRYIPVDHPDHQDAILYHIINVDNIRHAVSLGTANLREARAIVAANQRDFQTGNHDAYFTRMRQRLGLNPRARDYKQRLKELVDLGRMAQRELSALDAKPHARKKSKA